MKSLVLLVFYFVFVDAQLGPPSDKPRNVEVKTISPSSLRVTWQAPAKSDYIMGYVISYGNSKTAFSHCMEENCSHILEDLSRFTQYNIGVAVYYLMGTGPKSDLVNQTTAEGTPTNIKCDAISSEELHTSWDSLPSEALHGILKGYKVAYAPKSQFDDKEKREYKTTMANETVLHGLKKNTKYAFEVTATTNVGDGVPSYTFYCSTMEDVPDEIVDLKALVYGTEKVKLLWHPPLEANGEILYYTIYYRKSGSEVKMEKVLANTTSFEIFGLESNELYEFWVTASTKVGEGPALEFLTAIPSNETPPKIATYNGTFAVEFKENVTLPCDAVGSPMPNVIWKVNGDNLIQNERLQMTNGTLIIKSVIREDANNYTCIAENSFGNDSITHELVVLAPPRSPEVTILSTTTDEITLEVKPNSIDSAAIDRIKLYYKSDSNIEDWQTKSSFSQFYKISNCICGSPYKIYARGFNSYGDGDASEILTVRTNGSKPIAPTMSDFIEPSAESVTLHFSSWRADSCPISHFFVAFKKKENINWDRIRNKLRPDTDFTLNLEAATLYNIRVTALNAAGPTLADFEIETLIEHGTVAPPSNITQLPEAEETTEKI